MIWNYVWKRKSINYSQQKWGLAKDAQFIDDALRQINQDASLPVRALKELTESLHLNKGYDTNPIIFKPS